MRVVPLILGCLLTACDAYNAGLLSAGQSGVATPTAGSRSTLNGGSGGGDVMPSNGGSSGSTPSSCTDIPERCNGADDNCNTSIDEDATCALEHADAQCTRGVCELTGCERGFFDCNDMPTDGCEATRDTANCGQCPEACASLDAGSGSGGTSEPPEPDAAVDAGASMPDSGAMPDACLALVPTGRGAACDACACSKCATEVANCQGNTDAARAMKCDDVIQCYRINNCRNCGGTTSMTCTDCYNGGNGPCVGEVRIAAGGVDANDTGPLNAGNCSMMTPDMNACAAATALGACREAMCMTECM